MLHLFLAVQTQWRRNPRGWRTGLDYQGVEAAARLRGMSLQPEHFGLLQAMERETINLDANQSDDDTN